jgi:hypothetical protein
MFDRLQKPFLTVETGEAYQPLRVTYDILEKQGLVDVFQRLGCLEKNPNAESWTWYWRDDCDELHFDSVDSFRKNATHPIRLGTLVIKEDKLFLNLPSFKRACLGVPFFHRLIRSDIARVHHADFINKVFAVDERLPHGFTEVFKDEELDRVLAQRAEEYHRVQEQCEHAASAEAAAEILQVYTDAEAKKRLPYAERYVFDWQAHVDPEVVFLSFYIFLRGRELVAINRWFGHAAYALGDVADDIVHQVFGGLDIDILE